MTPPAARALARLLFCGLATLGSSLGCERLLGLEHGELLPEGCRSCSGGTTTTLGDSGAPGDAGAPVNEAGAPTVSTGNGGATTAHAGSSGVAPAAGGSEGSSSGGKAPGNGGTSGHDGSTSGAGGRGGGAQETSDGGEGGTAVPCTPEDTGEVCDGVDNDCDDRIDLEDGLSLSGAPQAFLTRQGGRIATVFSSESERFGTVWTVPTSDTGNTDIGFGVIDLAGAEVATGFLSGGASSILDVAIAEQAGVFALAWSGPAGVHFQRVSSEGSPLGAPVSVMTSEADYIALAAVPGGAWVAFWQDYDIFARRISASDELGPVVTVSGSVDFWPMRAVTSGNTVLLSYQSSLQSAGIALPSSLVGGDTLDMRFTQTSSALDVWNVATAADDDGFAVAAMHDRTLLFKIVDTRGQWRCGPVIVAEGHHPVDVARSENGFVLIGDDIVAEVDQDCRLRQRAISPLATFPGEVRVAGAPGRGYLVVWDADPLKEVAPIGWQRLGPRFCD
jgi:hypothetical protein